MPLFRQISAKDSDLKLCPELDDYLYSDFSQDNESEVEITQAQEGEITVQNLVRGQKKGEARMHHVVTQILDEKWLHPTTKVVKKAVNYLSLIVEDTKLQAKQLVK